MTRSHSPRPCAVRAETRYQLIVIQYLGMQSYCIVADSFPGMLLSILIGTCFLAPFGASPSPGSTAFVSGTRTREPFSTVTVHCASGRERSSSRTNPVRAVSTTQRLTRPNTFSSNAIDSGYHHHSRHQTALIRFCTPCVEIRDPEKRTGLEI